MITDTHPFPTCYWAFPTQVIDVRGDESLKEWWEADNGWWYYVETDCMMGLTVCVEYWGA